MLRQGEAERDFARSHTHSFLPITAERPQDRVHDVRRVRREHAERVADFIRQAAVTERDFKMANFFLRGRACE